MEKLMSMEEAAALAGMTLRTFRRRVSAGEIAALVDPRKRNCRLIRLVDLQSFLGEIGLEADKAKVQTSIDEMMAAKLQTNKDRSVRWARCHGKTPRKG